MNEEHGPSDAGERTPRHVPVLIEETLAALDLKPGEVFADLTAGLGGHASRAARAVAPGGTVILNDVDSTTLGQAEARVRREVEGISVVTIQGNFARGGESIAARGLLADGVLADLGFSSDQMDDGSRGFSFMRDGPLDMRMDPTLSITAKDLVASLPERELERILREYGEEPLARGIARKLAVERARGPIEKTTQLAEIVRAAVGHRGGGFGCRIHPATRTFQALRIAVNDELGVLDALLSAVTRGARKAGSEGAWLKPGARIAIITFHSLEDRMVKRAFQEGEAAGLWEVHDPAVVTPGEAEVERNPRSRSAKLRSVRLAV
ncbi:MAG: 16S rRNA (cytosine(1402)-N(4))-methyltransferase RsmH [Phycisphaerales bacterium]|nr:MAG: 16S rRNA (cytosine(1402)-N(4))-methyltransferase RsmH [Phycisphaerales bacterium]